MRQAVGWLAILEQRQRQEHFEVLCQMRQCKARLQRGNIPATILQQQASRIRAIIDGQIDQLRGAVRQLLPDSGHHGLGRRTSRSQDDLQIHRS